jgi:hypothetical protein
MFSPNNNNKAVLAPSLRRQQFVMGEGLDIVADLLSKQGMEDGTNGANATVVA